MPDSTLTRDPLLLGLKFDLPKNRDTGKPYGTTGYTYKGEFVYKRCYHAVKRYEYFRAPVGKVFHLTYWYDIPASLWEPVDVYGIPMLIK